MQLHYTSAIVLIGMHYIKMDNKIKLSLGAIITLALAISGTYYVAQDDDAYYCASKDMVMLCEKLSSGVGSRCYYEDTYKVCSEGWEKMQVGSQFVDDIEPPEVISAVMEWTCSVDGCIAKL